MNPAKRKKLYRASLAEQNKNVTVEKKLEQVKAEEPKKDLELGLKEMSVVESVKDEPAQEEKVLTTETQTLSTQTEKVPVEVFVDPKKKKKV